MESSSFQPNVRRTTMKMASTSLVSAFLLCCLAATSISSQDRDQFAALGHSFNVPLKYKLKPNDTLKWKFGETIVFNRRANKVIQGNESDINLDGSFKLANVTKDQEGLYTAEVFDQNGKEQTQQKIRLRVLDPVIKPTVNKTCKDKKVILKCVSEPQSSDTNYQWLQNNDKIVLGTKQSFEVKVEDIKANKFSCKVFNKASSEISEAVTNVCAKKGPLGLLDEDLEIWVLIGSGAGIVVLLILILIICFIQTKQRKKLRLQEEDELRLTWTQTEQHNHPHNHPPLPDHPPPYHPNRHHHPQQKQQAPGNTGPRQSRSKQNRQPRPRAPEPNGQPQPSPRRNVQANKPANDTDEETPPPLPQPRKNAPKAQIK